MVATAVSFVVFLLAFTGIGIYSATRKRETPDDYLVASRSVGPWATALSAVATNNSGFMFIGLIGATYVEGISAMWLMVGWVLGDWIAWFFVHEKLRRQSEQQQTTTIGSFLASGIKDGRKVAIVAGLITLVFLGLYSAAQLAAGGKAMHHVFGWDVKVAAVIGAVIVAAYCFAGGIRASIWTDVAQSVVMISAVIGLFVTGVVYLGGPGELWAGLEAIDAKLTVVAPSHYKFGFIGYLLGWFGAGAGVIGQPHVMIRAMAIDSPNNMKTARRIYVIWYLVFSAACIGVGLAARVIIDPPLLGQGADPELALPILSDALFPGVLVGMMLAGVFAATISTADSQILSSSAALTQDLAPGTGKSYTRVKLATLLVTGFALTMALFGEHLGVFALVTIAWSSLAAGLGPLLLVRVMKWNISANVGLITMLAGVAGSLGWRYGLKWHEDIYDAFPGMVAGFAAYLILAKLTWGGIHGQKTE